VAVALSVGGSVASISEVLPAPDELADDVVLRVIETPAARGTVTLAEFQHELELVAVRKGRNAAPGPHAADYPKLEKESVDSLLEAAWLRGQAYEWGISVGRREIKQEVKAIKRESFRSGAEFRAFLRESHYTRRDVYGRVELQVLSTRVQARLKRQIGHVSRREEQRAFTKFVKEFEERWRSRTVCAPDYVTERCSNGAPLSAGTAS
jgi:hypothetical protein